MYFTNITENEVKQFHDTIKITASYHELNNLNAGALFDKTHDMKLVPKFYFDKIKGDSDKLTILDDLLVLYVTYMEDTVELTDLDKVYFSSEDQRKSFGVLHEVVTVNGKYYLKLHFYDNITLFNLSNFNFNITQSNNGIHQDYTTDIYGNCIIPLQSDEGIFTVTSNNAIITWGE